MNDVDDQVDDHEQLMTKAVTIGGSPKTFIKAMNAIV